MTSRLWSRCAALFGEDRERIQGWGVVGEVTECVERAAEQ
jgi:hypothetical protein